MPAFLDFHAWIRTSLEVSHGYAEDCVKDIPDHRLAEQPAGLVNHGAWTLGHLVFACQLDVEQLAGPLWLPAHWESLFGTGSTPTADRARYPARDDLITALHDARARVLAAIHSAGDAALNNPLPDERLRPYLPTLGHLVVQTVAAHTAYHVGQLLLWRKALGQGGVGYPYL